MQTGQLQHQRPSYCVCLLHGSGHSDAAGLHQARHGGKVGNLGIAGRDLLHLVAELPTPTTVEYNVVPRVLLCSPRAQCQEFLFIGVSLPQAGRQPKSEAERLSSRRSLAMPARHLLFEIGVKSGDDAAKHFRVLSELLRMVKSGPIACSRNSYREPSLAT